MADRIIENYHVDVPYAATSLNNTNATGRYMSVKHMSRALFILHGGAAAATKTWKLEIYEASDAAGSDGAAVTSVTATGTANTKVKKATVALASAANTDKVTVTQTTAAGTTAVVYTMAASADAAAHEFDDADELATQITADFDYLSAADSTTNCVITAADPATVTVAGTDVAGTVTVSTQESVTAVEVHNSDLDSDTTHIAPKVTVTGNGVYGVVSLMEMKSLPDGQGNFSAVYPT